MLVPLIKPDMQISRIRLSRQVHRVSYRGVVRDLQELQTQATGQKLVVSHAYRVTVAALAPTIQVNV